MTRGALKRRYVGPNEWLDEWLERLGEPWAHCAIRDSGSFRSSSPSELPNSVHTLAA